MRKRIQKGLIVGAAVLLGGCAYLLLYSRLGIGIPCVFHLVTGLSCPGCGVTRMLLSLMRLDFSAAFRYNAVLLCLTPFLLFLFGFWLYRYIRYGSWKSPKPVRILCWSVVGILLVWGVVRNIIGM